MAQPAPQFPRPARRASRWRADAAPGPSPLADLRPRSPAQLAAVGVGLCLLGALVPRADALVLLGLVVLVVAGLGQLARPRSREMYWRGRRIELPEEPTLAQRVYRVLFRR